MKNNPENLAIYSHLDQITKKHIPGDFPYSTLKFVTEFPSNMPPKEQLTRVEQALYTQDVIDIARLNDEHIPRQDMMWPLITKSPPRSLKLPFIGIMPFMSPSDHGFASYSGIIYPSTVTDGRENLYYVSNIFFFDPTGYALKAEQLSFLTPLSNQITFEEKLRGWVSDPTTVGRLNFHPQNNDEVNYEVISPGDYEKMCAAIGYINTGRATLKYSSTSAA